jgi:Ni/Fe-hydrogenase 1 B-type cytochrome subunit
MSKKCAADRFVYVWEVPVRLTHWVNFFCIIILSVTGYYIHNPFIHAHDIINTPYVMGTIRYVHYLTGIVFSVSVLLRIWWMIVGNQYANLLYFFKIFTKDGMSKFFAYLKYYMFLGKKTPHVLGHNPVALMAYIVLFFLFIYQIVSGFAMWALANPEGQLFAYTSWLTNIMHIQWVRFFHYLIMFLIGGFVINHLYSAVLMDFKTQSGEISSIFTGWKAHKKEG